MNFMERVEAGLIGLFLTLLTSIFAGVAWLVRRVLTNEAQIKMLQREIDMREIARAKDRVAIEKLLDKTAADVRDIREHMMRRNN
jgi:hypothetical protein